jgi:hypothetical protein
MASITAVRDQREPGTIIFHAEGFDGSFAAIAGSTTATWWVSVEAARRFHNSLGQRLAEITTPEGGTS